MERVCCVGLGNPGHEYQTTRHNIGFRVVDLLGRRNGARWESVLGVYDRAEVVTPEGAQILLVKPRTYMNASGRAVEEILADAPLPLERLLIVMDDLALPLGRLRMRGQGSDGGHRGLASVLFALGTTLVPRLRCGIGTPEMPQKDDLPEFVLSPFTPEEEATAEKMIERAADAAMMFAQAGIGSAMSWFNAR